VESQLSLTARREGASLRLSAAGELDRAAAGRVDRAVEQALLFEIDQIVLDLSAVTFLDLSAIRSLLSAQARTRDQGVDLTVVRPTGTASRIFTLTRVGAVLPVTDRNPRAANP
jgi:anti-sigma B factor antagonist